MTPLNLKTSQLYRKVKLLAESNRYEEVHETLSGIPKDQLLRDPHLCMYAVAALGRLYQTAEAANLLLAMRPYVLTAGNASALRRWQQGYAVHLIHQGELDDARRLLLECLESAESGDDQRAVAYSCNSLGIVSSMIGELEAAIQCYNRTVTAWQKVGNAHGVGLGHFNLAVVYREWGGVRNASGHMVLAQEYLSEYGSPKDVVFISLEKPMLLLSLGDVSLAEISARNTLRRAGENDSRPILARAQRILGAVLLERGELAEAEEMLDEALSKIREEPNLLLEADINGDLALIALIKGLDQEFEQHRSTAEQFYAKIGAAKRSDRLSQRIASYGYRTPSYESDVANRLSKIE